MSDSWYGWMRRDRRHKWQRIIGPCSTMADCSRQLGAAAKRQGIPDRNTFMTTGGYPRDVRQGMEATPPLAQGELSGDERAKPSGKYLEGF
jgi:hypothetical protein